ncbi:MAG TPA: hypothetical protein VJY39_03695 [Acidisphaera sp.]|nr:hypothetical protein [Acidisphaera sp.]
MTLNLPPPDAPVMWELWRPDTVKAKTGLSRTAIFLRLHGAWNIPTPALDWWPGHAWMSADVIAWMASLPATEPGVGPDTEAGHDLKKSSKEAA